MKTRVQRCLHEHDALRRGVNTSCGVPATTKIVADLGSNNRWGTTYRCDEHLADARRQFANVRFTEEPIKEQGKDGKV